MRQITLCFLSFLFVTSCVNDTVKNFLYGYYTQMELENKIDFNKKDFILIDLRSEHQYAKGHIPTAINIPSEDIESITDKDYRWFDIILYHSELSIQRNAFESLTKMGYQNVYMLSGGYYSWTGDIEINE